MITEGTEEAQCPFGLTQFLSKKERSDFLQYPKRPQALGILSPLWSPAMIPNRLLRRRELKIFRELADWSGVDHRGV
jgi:hypothetical protein